MVGALFRTLKGGKGNKVTHPASPRAETLERKQERMLPLLELPLNVEARVTRIDISDPKRIHRLASLGILPGATLRLIQKRGAFLARIDRYQVGFDKKVAGAVWVSPIP
jgi:Fe2+ transport system protein FeoA